MHAHSAQPVPIAAPLRAMIDSQLRTNEVTDPALVKAIAAVARDAFVPAGQQSLAYSDRPVPLGGGRSLNPALTTARLIAAAHIRPGTTVLLIGGATGYAAAVLARIGARVTLVEESPDLMAHARRLLEPDAAISLVDGPLAAGAPQCAPFDRLMIDGAVEHLPATLLGQLADGAVIVTGIVDRGVTRLARAVCVSGAQTVQPVAFADLECVALPGFALPSHFTF